MSIFDKIKSTLGLQKQKSKQSAGHRLGGNDLVVDNEQEISFNLHSQINSLINTKDKQKKALTTYLLSHSLKSSYLTDLKRPDRK